MNSLAASFLNLFILVGFLGYKLKGPTREFVASRHRSLREEIHSVKSQLQLAQDKYDEFSSKLKALDSEVAILNEQMKQDIAAMKQRVLADGRRLANTLLSDAKNSADSLMVDLRRESYSELVVNVLHRVEKILPEKLTSEERTRMQKEFSVQVGSAS